MVEKIKEFLNKRPIKVYDSELESYIYTEKQVIKIIKEFLKQQKL